MAPALTARALTNALDRARHEARHCAIEAAGCLSRGNTEAAAVALDQLPAIIAEAATAALAAAGRPESVTWTGAFSVS